VLTAADDPHGRVRHALLRVLLRWGEDSDARRREIDDRLAAVGDGARVRGVRAYLRWRWSGTPPAHFPAADAADPARVCPFWDWDPAVLARTLDRMGDAGRRQALDVMPFLLGHDDERVRSAAVDVLRRWGESAHVAQAVAILDEPRAGAGDSVADLLRSLDLDRTEAAARLIHRLPEPTPTQLAWAVDQAGVVFPCVEEEAALLRLFSIAVRPPVGRALARLAARWDRPEAATWLHRFLDDPDPETAMEALRGLRRRPELLPDVNRLACLLASEYAPLRAAVARAAVASSADAGLIEAAAADPGAVVRAALAECLAGRDDAASAAVLARLQTGPHPHVCAAALTPGRAAALVRDPSGETSWHVLARAARLARTPLWKLAPEPPWRPPAAPPAAAVPLHVRPLAPPHARPLGPERWPVSVVGVSGHYGLPVEGFARAAEAGVNLMFWEPNYRTLTEFFTRLSPSGRDAIRLVAGTFEADGVRVRRDAERALRAEGRTGVAVPAVLGAVVGPRLAGRARGVGGVEGGRKDCVLRPLNALAAAGR
jgi:hypothetical protein